VATVVATRLGIAVVGERWPSLLIELVRLQRIADVHGATMVCVVVIAVAEEFIWREGLQQAWLSRWQDSSHVPLRAITATAIVYGLAQSGPQSLWLVAAGCGLGWVWGWLRWWSGSLWPSLVAHLMWTIATVVLWPVGG
jgi:membrane protease YdiL (CAAX protease family)